MIDKLFNYKHVIKQYNSKYNKTMLKDHFQKSTSTLNILRSQHFKVSEYLNKGKYKLRKKLFSTGGKTKHHYDFDLNTQQFLHQEIDDIIFQQTQIQQIFYNQIHKSMEEPISYNNKIKVKDFGIGVRKNPSEVRVLLARHFHNRAVDLSYKKYQTLLRVHNLGEQQHLTAVKSRTNLIQKQIQLCLNRQTRLEVEDYFEQSYTQGGKPRAGNENGKPIYKELDQQQCWFSNINRNDIQAYIRNILFRDDILNNVYWPYWYRCEYIVFNHGLDLCKSIQGQFLDKKNKDKQNILNQAKFMIRKLEKGLQDLSQAGNLVEKQNLANFMYNITGINSDQPICIPIYPATYSQLISHYKKSTDPFFNNLPLSNHKQIIDIIPKLNSFCLILFKYQNKQILQGKKQIKLGLEDEVDIKKQLITMLEQQWVSKYVTKLDFLRFQYKLEIKKIDWPMDQYSLRLQQENKLVNSNGYAPDSSLEQLIRAVRMTEYLQFRRIMKKRSQKVVNRVKTKYEDMFLVQKYFRRSEQEINMEKLSQIYNLKQVEQKQLKKGQISQITKSLFDRIISVLLIKNPVEVQITQTLTCVKIREMRTRILNICNGFRCYQRNINMDLRVIDGCQFTFELDDDFLINSNKQVIEHFQKEIKETQTFISKAKSGNSLGPPTLQEQDFLIHKKLEKSMFYKKDKIKRQNYNRDENSNNIIPHILVIDGKKKKKILYNKSLEDLKLVESRILELGTHFINKYESIIKMRSLSEIVDRANVLCELFELQERYLYQKFNLIEAYYYLYENTVQPLNAHKIAKIIIQIMYEVPKIDLNSSFYKFSYQTLIETLQTQTKIVKVFTNLVEDEEKEKNKVFHKKFAKICQIPLTLWAYAYKDMQVKTAKNYSKLQRINSVSSKLSRNSKQSKEKQAITEIKDKINEQFGQDSDYEPEEFDIEKYDEYALRSMDQLFKDIVGGDEQNNHKDKDAGLGTSSLGLENITVNPKFQGGPHPLHNYLPRISITSEKEQKLLNFSQHICLVANIHQLIKKLTKQGRERYGYCSHEYQLCLQKHICLKINQILHEQIAKVPQFYQFQTDDVYLQTVTKDMNAFESIMNPILFLPSKTQLSLHSTHQIHQRNYLSEFLQTKTLEKFDVNILSNLIKLEKPINTAVYRELNLSINLLEFIRLRQKIRQIHYRRQQVFKAYQLLGQYNNFKLQKYEHCYNRSGLSNPTFQSLSEIKQYHQNIKKLPSFNESIEQLRNICELEQTQLKLFESFVEMAKEQIQDYFRFLWDIEKQNCNKIVNRNTLLISLSKSNVEMVGKKVRNYIKIIAEDIFQNKSYLKYKLSIKSVVQQKIKITNETHIGDYILKHYLDNDTKKYSHICNTILSEKIKKSIAQEYIKFYTNDLKNQLANNQTFLELTKSIRILKNYAVSLPYMAKLFTIPTEFQKLLKQKFDDQKKINTVPQKNQNIDEDIFYVYSKQQLIESWHQIPQNITPIKLNQSINIEEYVKSTLPPDNKELIFKWMYKIPTNNINQNQKEALRHLLKVYQPFTGKISVSEYRYSLPPCGSRNKFSELSTKYSILIEYIESNLLIICLQVDDDIIDSLFSIVDHGYKFEEKYPLKDQISIYENYSKEGQKQAQYMNDSVLAPCFLYENKKDELEKKLKIKLSSRGYSTDKNGVRFSILDEITDFIVSKVQGYGVFRQSMVEMKDEIELFKKIKPETAINYMKSKTRNIYNLMWLSLWENYNSKNDPKTNIYTPIFMDQLVSRPKLETLKTSLCNNTWRGLSRQIQSDLEAQEQQKLKFHKGIYDLENDLLISKLKVAHNFIPLDYNEICERYIYKSENQKPEKQAGNRDNFYINRHNWENFQNFKQIIKKPGEKFRFQLFGRLRDEFQKGKNFIRTKTDSTSLPALVQLQQKKQAYFQYQTHSKINMIALTAFKLAKSENFPDDAHQFCEQFNKVLVNNKEKIQYNAFNIYDQLEAYENNGKIVFSKTQNGLMVKGPMSFQAIQHSNKLVRNIIFSKLTTEEFKNEILEVAIRLLKSENLRKNDKKGDSKHDTKMEPKKVQNQSYLPRVHLISSFSSPLIIERKTYISQQHKLAFVQAFINRFRNKVSRVDLLSSGFGFVITVPDLEDCLNYMNKLLFTFTEKEFKSRLDTFSQYFEILRDGIKQRDQKIVEQAQIIKYLQDKLKNTIEADYLSKVSKLLQQKYLIEQKLTLAEQAANGLQHRVRKAVQYQYDSKITSLQKQNKYLRDQFEKFKDIFIKLTKDETKNNFLALVNQLKEKVSKTLDKKIDLSESFSKIQQINVVSPSKRVKVQQQEIKISTQSDRQYGQQDIQSCKIGQDIIHDPYYVTKLINKMRLFNLFKMGSKRIKYQNIEQKRVKELTSLHKIQDRVVVQTQKQYEVQKQFIIKNQQNSIKQKQLQITKQALSTLSNQKQKLKQQLIVKEKKLQQKQREIQEYKKFKLEFQRLTNQQQGLKKNRNQSRQSRKLDYASQQIRQQKKQQYKSGEKKPQKQEPTKLSNVRHHKKSIKYMDPEVKSFLTSIQERSAPRSLYQNFELSNKDSTWREKCQQLYLDNRKLQNQLQQLKRKGKDNNERPTGTTTPKKEGYSLNMRNKRSAQGSEKDSNISDRIRFPNASYKYSIMRE